MITKEQFLADFRDLLSTQQNIDMDTDLLDIDGWDSFSAISFLSMIKEKYGIKAEPFDVAEAIFVGDLYDIIHNN